MRYNESQLKSYARRVQAAFEHDACTQVEHGVILDAVARTLGADDWKAVRPLLKAGPVELDVDAVARQLDAVDLPVAVRAALARGCRPRASDHDLAAKSRTLIAGPLGQRSGTSQMADRMGSLVMSMGFVRLALEVNVRYGDGVGTMIYGTGDETSDQLVRNPGDVRVPAIFLAALGHWSRVMIANGRGNERMQRTDLHVFAVAVRDALKERDAHALGDACWQYPEDGVDLLMQMLVGAYADILRQVPVAPLDGKSADETLRPLIPDERFQEDRSPTGLAHGWGARWRRSDHADLTIQAREPGHELLGRIWVRLADDAGDPDLAGFGVEAELLGKQEHMMDDRVWIAGIGVHPHDVAPVCAMSVMRGYQDGTYRVDILEHEPTHAISIPALVALSAVVRGQLLDDTEHLRNDGRSRISVEVEVMPERGAAGIVLSGIAQDITRIASILDGETAGDDQAEAVRSSISGVRSEMELPDGTWGAAVMFDPYEGPMVIPISNPANRPTADLDALCAEARRDMARTGEKVADDLVVHHVVGRDIYERALGVPPSGAIERAMTMNSSRIVVMSIEATESIIHGISHHALEEGANLSVAVADAIAEMREKGPRIVLDGTGGPVTSGGGRTTGERSHPDTAHLARILGTSPWGAVAHLADDGTWSASVVPDPALDDTSDVKVHEDAAFAGARRRASGKGHDTADRAEEGARAMFAGMDAAMLVRMGRCGGGISREMERRGVRVAVFTGRGVGERDFIDGASFVKSELGERILDTLMRGIMRTMVQGPEMTMARIADAA